MKYLMTVAMAVVTCSVATPDDKQPPGSAMTLQQLQSRKADSRRNLSPILEVSPAVEPVPALRYRFAPAVWETRPTSAMLHYARAMIHLLEMPPGVLNQWESPEWQEADHDDGPTDRQLAEAVAAMGSVFTEIHQLGLAEDVTWDHRLRDLEGPKIYEYLLPDVQNVRRLARLLRLKIRHQLNQGDFDGVVQSIQDGLRLSQFVSHGETLIQQLVAIAVAAITSDEINNVIQHPDAPNLYWALATVPRPVVSVRDSALWELHAIHRALPVLDEAETANWTEEEATKAWSSMLDDLKKLGGLSGYDLNQTAVALTATAVVESDRARARLEAAGVSRERIEQMPKLQIALADASQEITRVSDEMAKLFLLPVGLSETLRDQIKNKRDQWLRSPPATTGATIGRILMPAVEQIIEAELRTHMRLNRLMTVEAIRMHLAEHNGKPPATLDDLSPVPAMVDPFTGKHFDYRVESDEHGQVVILEAAGPTTYLPLKILRFRVRQ